VKPPSIRDQVHCFGCASDEDYFFRVFRVNKICNGFPSVFMQVCGFLRQRVDCPVNISVVVLVKVTYGINYLPRLLGGCSVVKVD
jgi:hypothetical protein